ncbi:hypothetical protein, partial [Flavobacterium jumunjinense]
MSVVVTSTADCDGDG